MEKKSVLFIACVGLSVVAMVYCFFSDFFPSAIGAIENDNAVSNLIEQNKDAIGIASDLGGLVAENVGKFIPDNPEDIESNITSQISSLKYDTDGTFVSARKSNPFIFTINIDGDNTEICLIGVALPEDNLIGKNGTSVSDIVNSYLKDSDTVHVEYDVGRTNQYGKTLAYVYFQNGLMVQDWLLSNGYAKSVTVQPNDKYAAHFESLEKKAQDNKVGMWADK